MSEADTRSGKVKVVLQGGPPTLPKMFFLAHAAIVDRDRLVIAHCGRNEHFTFTGEVVELEGMGMPVAEWMYSTAIAE
ncbi:DUF5988 family protein [Streptomyces chrestomyceticus]|uniref:DUF5988 family protein n=1 Tax=Streptomyces chrestomyceticus TaxID=68185 RepID=UPI0033FB4162